MLNPQNISFIVPAYNAELTLAASVKSICDGNLAPGDEVIIVDDASTDGTLGLARELARHHDAIRVVGHHLNKGSAAAGRNTGIDHASNNLIYCLDADNVLVPGTVPLLKDYMLEQQAEVAAFRGLSYFQTTPEEVVNRIAFDPEPTFISSLNHPERSPCSWGNYLYTKESWRRAGRYNEFAFGIAYDSCAFGLYQLATGSKMVTLPDSFYYHRCGYESTFFRNIDKMNTSLLMLQILMPFLHLLNEADVDYMMSHYGRTRWYAHCDAHPIRLKSKHARTSRVQYRIADTFAFLGEQVRNRLLSSYYRLVTRMRIGPSGAK